MAGCDGVFHVASPVPAAKTQNPEVEVLAPAVMGTQNMLKACREAKVRRVVVVSSAAADIMNPNFPKDAVLDEDAWSDEKYCRNTGVGNLQFYFFFSSHYFTCIYYERKV